jgi:regulator of sirC expression with transglutaminase-like and TPR domain
MFPPGIVAKGFCAGASIAMERKRTAFRMQLAILNGGAWTLRDLTELLTNDRATITLDRASLDIARLEYPGLDPEPSIRRLDEIASEIEALSGPGANGRAFIEAANRRLFLDLGLRGNERDYYDVRNSCLNDVLDRRLGIPITLSVIYMEIARRLRRPVYGIGLPSHFIVQYDDGEFDTYIDPFHGGELLTRSECVDLVVERTGAAPPPSAFLPCLPKQIVLRMLQNLKGVYVQSGAFDKALKVVDLVVSSRAFLPGEYKQRAVILLQMRRYRAAMADLESYLKGEPQAADRGDVVKQIEVIHRYLGALN